VARVELVIGRGSRGYVALYRYVPEIDTVFVLAVRSQREAGCAR
jgi:toxin ParE1/3/4